MAEDVGEVPVKRDQHTTLGAGHGEHVVIHGADELLIPRECDVVPRLTEDRTNRVWDVLVQLYGGHDYAVISTMLSRASSAAYASAAAIASFGSVG